ncbi:MAG TPA: hypothetical protein DCF33_14825 [Saprospirales bacterium]|nr:hypothetical protein [Saprospirales bacterium]
MAFLLVSCQKNAPQDAVVPVNTTETSNLSLGVIPKDIELNKFIFNPQNFSWKAVDEYYRQEVLIKHKSDSFYNNLRKVTIATLVNQYDFLQSASINQIEFYANELMAIDLPDPAVFIKVMDRLKGHWTDQKIQAISNQKYSETQRFIQNNLNEPEKFLQKEGDKYEAIKTFAAGISQK